LLRPRLYDRRGLLRPGIGSGFCAAGTGGNRLRERLNADRIPADKDVALM
jgi:hypothetical protein